MKSNQQRILLLARNVQEHCNLVPGKSRKPFCSQLLPHLTLTSRTAVAQTRSSITVGILGGPSTRYARSVLSLTMVCSAWGSFQGKRKILSRTSTLLDFICDATFTYASGNAGSIKYSANFFKWSPNLRTASWMVLEMTSYTSLSLYGCFDFQNI